MLCTVTYWGRDTHGQWGTTLPPGTQLNKTEVKYREARPGTVNTLPSLEAEDVLQKSIWKQENSTTVSFPHLLRDRLTWLSSWVLKRAVSPVPNTFVDAEANFLGPVFSVILCYIWNFQDTESPPHPNSHEKGVIYTEKKDTKNSHYIKTLF